MDQSTFMALLIGTLAVIVPLFIACVTPIIKLNRSIQKLNDSIDRLNESDSKKTATLESISNKINSHNEYLCIDKKRLDNLSRRMHKIDNEEGFIDTTDRNDRK